MDKLPNLAQYRELALERLIARGHEPASYAEIFYLGQILLATFEEPRDEPIFNILDYEFQVLRMGKWEFLLTFLSPWNAVSSDFPLLAARIAGVLFGFERIPDAVRQQAKTMEEAEQRRRPSS